MNGLPGNLTKCHLELARKRGDDYIIYHHRYYTLEELENGAGISRVERKPETSQNVHSRRIKSRNGAITESDSDSRETQS